MSSGILKYILIDGKFYSIFSLLFGIGFSFQRVDALQNGINGLSVFYRRIGILAVFGLLHLVFLWSGDILLLYALIALFLPLFRNVSNQKLLVFSAGPARPGSCGGVGTRPTGIVRLCMERHERPSCGSCRQFRPVCRQRRPASLAYVSAFCLWHLSGRTPILFKLAAAPGRMALTNYIGQSVAGMVIFYGIGFALGALELVAAGVFLVQIAFSCL